MTNRKERATVQILQVRMKDAQESGALAAPQAVQEMKNVAKIPKVVAWPLSNRTKKRAKSGSSEGVHKKVRKNSKHESSSEDSSSDSD